jgi:diguanylate cyclase (GGDEF)-like protein
LLGARINPLGAIKLALMLVIAAFAAATIYTSIVIGERQEALRNTNRYNVAWLASQGATELARFMERLSASAVAGSGVDADEVRLRYEILANRVRLFKDGEFRAFAETAPERREIVTAFRDAVRAGEKLIDRSDQPDARERLRELLGPLEAKLSRLAAEAHRASSEQATEDQLELLALHRTFSALAVGLICCGLALLVLVICHNRLLARMQRQLRARTDDLRHTSAQLNVALDNMSQGLCMVDAEARLTLFNGRFLGLFGLRDGAIAAGEGLGGAFRRSPYFAEGRQILDALPRAGRTNASLLALSDGRCISATYQPLPEGGWVGTYEDITERREAEAKIAHMAHFDALTDLPNRVVLMDRLESTLARLRRGGQGAAVLSLDLDRFKSVNDSLGHAVGDQLLQAVAERLLGCVEPGQTVARFGGDEFIILLNGRPADAEALARRVGEVIGRPYQIEGREIVIATSIGISVGPADGTDPHQLLKNADLALYRAKSDGRGTHRFFEPAMDTELQARRSLELDLRQALAREELDIHYQPIVDLRTGAVVAYEALLRWNHPERGAVSPATFIPLAEEIGFISAIGTWVLRRACQEAARWPDHIRLALNLSPVQFRNRELAAIVSETLASSGLAASRLELEITETVLLDENDATLSMLHELRALGTRIALDDFGTGFSSLSYLRNFPFDKIKVDRSFVRDSERPDCIAIIRSVAMLAANLHMVTTAEGIETPDQLARIRDVGCTEGQGYLFARPKPARDLDHGLTAPIVEAPRLSIVRQIA